MAFCLPVAAVLLVGGGPAKVVLSVSIAIVTLLLLVSVAIRYGQALSRLAAHGYALRPAGRGHLSGELLAILGPVLVSATKGAGGAHRIVARAPRPLSPTAQSSGASVEGAKTC